MSDKLSAALHGSGPCCAKCKTPWGVCATKWTCDHHRESANEQSRRDWAAEFNAELRESEAASKRATGFAPWR